MPAYNWLRNSMPIACDVSGLPRRFVRPHALARFRSCSFVYWPVAYSSNARRTSGARSESCIRLLPIDRGAFKSPIGARNTHRPSSSAAFIPTRVRSERTSLSNCANAASTPSINLPVDVSSIGSVAERREMPSDCRWERSAKSSYLSCAKRTRHEMHAALVQTAVREQPLKLAAVRRLRALAFLVEAFEHVVPLAAAVLLARAELCGQTEILGLLFSADAHVDHRADHERQIRPICGHRQGASARHVSTRSNGKRRSRSRPGSTPSFQRVDGST